MNEGNPLVLSTVEDEQAHDDLLLALTSIATPMKTQSKVAPARTPPPAGPRVIRKKKRVQTPQERRIEHELASEGRHRSRFFFSPTKSFADQVTEARAALAPEPPIPTDNAEIDERVSGYIDELPQAMESKITAVREFFLNEVAPKDFAMQAAIAQSIEILQKTLNAGISQESHMQFKRMVDRARLYKMAEFVVGYMGLPKAMAKTLVQSIEPQREVLFMGANPADDRRRPAQKQVKPNGQQQED